MSIRRKVIVALLVVLSSIYISINHNRIDELKHRQKVPSRISLLFCEVTTNKIRFNEKKENKAKLG